MWLKHKQKYINLMVLPNFEIYIEESLKDKKTIYHLAIQLGTLSYRLTGFEEKTMCFRIKKRLNTKMEDLIKGNTDFGMGDIVSLSFLLEKSLVDEEALNQASQCFF